MSEYGIANPPRIDRDPKAAAPRDESSRGRLVRIVGTPVALALVLLLLWLWVGSQSLDTIEERAIGFDKVMQRVGEHIYLAAVSTVLVVLIGIPLGVLLSRKWARSATPAVLGLANIGQATPVIGVLVLLSLWLGIGVKIALIGLVAYSVLPVLRNTLVGIQQVDRTLVEAGRAMGMTASDVLLRVEMRLATPVIMAGVRTALVLNVGVATLAVFVDAGGLGDLIVTGIKLQRDPVLIVGCVLTSVLALLIDWIAGLVEDGVRPRGLTE